MADVEQPLSSPVAADPPRAQEDNSGVTKVDTENQSQENVDSDDYFSEDEEIVLDEPSDTENFEPSSDGNVINADDADDESCSSGDEEEGVSEDLVEINGLEFYKLRFADVEAKRREYEAKMNAHEEEDDVDPAQTELKKEEDQSNQPSSDAPTDYRMTSILNSDLEGDYNSNEDDDFDPVYCGETLSDIEYAQNDERDTESEPETEEIDGKHKKTGESLICIKMMEKLQIPMDDLRSGGDVAAVGRDQCMECS